MELKISIKYIPCLIISLLLLTGNKAFSCGWSEDEETIRLALFRAQLNNGSAFHPFLYSFNYFNSKIPDPERLDQLKNCQEWQTKLGKNVPIKDIDIILYNTDPEIFQIAYSNNELSVLFEGNSFIGELLKKQNIALLNYLVFAKEMEYFSFTNLNGGKWESWDIVGYRSKAYYNNDYSKTENAIPAIKDVFLQQRYAFLMLRYFYYTGRYQDCVGMYDKYFSGSSTKTIIEPWALLFKALSVDVMGDKANANYLFSQVFDRSDEKKLAAYRNFNKAPEVINKTLSLTSSDKEKAIILTMSVSNYPGPVLEKIKTIYDMGVEDKYFAFLITREINKLEDWIFTPKFTQYTSAVSRTKEEKGIWYYDYNNKWKDYERIKENNYKTDINYLRDLRDFLTGIYPNAKSELKSYIAMAIAHLYYIDDDIIKGRAYISSIPVTANTSIITQKNIELALVELNTSNIRNSPYNTVLLTGLRHLEKIAAVDPDTYKSLYSLTRIMSNTYLNAGNNAVAGMLFTKSEQYKKAFELKNNEYYYEYYNFNMYNFIGYFDRIASPGDIDKVLEIIENRNKTDFEKYLCEQPLGSRYVYLDLKGTIAFRNNDLETAVKIFDEIPQMFYDTAYAYRYYLNEDPFVPKAWRYLVKRNFDYDFNKSVFINTLITLKKEAETDPQKAADNYLLLGHAYYNCSYQGNSWMMISYGNSSADNFFNHNDYLYGPQYELRKKMQKGNYYNCTLAKQYYVKSLNSASNDEQRAMASLMIHICDYDSHLASLMNVEYDESKKYIPEMPLRNFYKKYNDTEVFKLFNCPLLEDFIARK